MKNKKVWMCLGILAVIIIIAIVYTNRTSSESGYAKCLCKGVKGPGGGPYYNFHCCQRAGASGASTATGVA